MPSWPAKDPDAVLDYRYTIPLGTGDTVASHTLTRLDGTVTIDDEELDGADVVATLSGGVDGETSVFRIAWSTVAGREDNAVLTLAVASHELEALVLTGYAKPAAGHLVLKYPAFADVDSGTIRFWLTDAERSVDQSWGETDYAAGLMALAAHNMAVAGVISDGTVGLPAGVTRMKSGSLELGFSESAAKDRIAGALGSTRYGAEYLALLRRNRAGPLVMATGTSEGEVMYPGRWNY